ATFSRPVLKRTASLVAENEIQDPATPDVIRPQLSAMVENGWVATSGFFEGVRQDGETGGVESPPRERTLLVGCPGQLRNGGLFEKRTVEDGQGPEGVTDDAAEDISLEVQPFIHRAFLCRCRPPCHVPQPKPAGLSLQALYGPRRFGCRLCC